MLRIELREDSPGYAQFSARKWKGTNEVEIAVQRNQDRYYFAGNNQWTPEPVWHKTSELTVEGDALQGRVGPWLIDGLMSQMGNVRFLLQVRDGTIEDGGALSLVGNILASSAGGDSSRDTEVREVIQPVVEETLPPLVEPIEVTVEPVIEETIAEIPVIEELDAVPPVVEPPVQKKSRLGLIISLLLLLSVIGGAVAYFLLSNKSSAPTSAPVVSECSVASSTDELAFIQRCLKTKPDSKRVLAVIAEAKAANKCSIAQRLYAHQAQGGNAEIALAYAKEYEVGSPCFAKDKENAIYWYETVLSIEPNNEAAKKSLAELKK
ncbi:hypothetical protein [Pasteurella oralis]|uniref:hypothetical protein n=1 Tax=Pasteurella oralis TaxID=1071947 RepID=UPI000C7D04DF|nr:hypothetical protein [Pasteurella oralis]